MTQEDDAFPYGRIKCPECLRAHTGPCQSRADAGGAVTVKNKEDSMNELHGRIAESGIRAADAEWLAAIRKWENDCDSGRMWEVIDAAAGEHDHACAGCAPLRALLKRAMEREALP